MLLPLSKLQNHTQFCADLGEQISLTFLIPIRLPIIGDIDPDAIAAFEKDGATPLPHMLTGEKLPPGVVAALSHLGVCETDNTMTASLKINKVHPAFHPSQF